MSLPANGVLANDSNPDGNPLTAVLASNPAYGSVTLNPDGSFSYVPSDGFYGVDSFTYYDREWPGDLQCGHGLSHRLFHSGGQ